MPEVSVIICTHNPNISYLRRAVEAIEKQTLKKEKLELLLIDNNSNISIKDLPGFNWPETVRHLYEEKVGLISARIKGIEEAKGDLLVFVDDDNYLKEDYLEILFKTMHSMPLLGVLGAGKILPEFEKPPTKEEIPFLRSLAIRNEERAHFSNAVGYHKAIPFGAGLCIRRSIALGYIESCMYRPIAASLDRKGEALLSGGDIDLALHSCRDGYLSGVLPELELIHFIPKSRLDQKYLIKIAAGHAASNFLLSQLWNFEGYPENPLIRWARYWKNRLKSNGLSRKILIAEYYADKKARNLWSLNNKLFF
jgi:glycosyltransferase involved in cell wall biosynthesis